MKKTTKGAAFILILLVFIGISNGQRVVEAIVAIVNDEMITISEFKAQYDALYQVMKAQMPAEQFTSTWMDFKKTILDNMITEKLLLQEGYKMGYSMEERFREWVEDFKKQQNITSDAEFIQLIQQQGITFEEFKKRKMEDLLRETVIITEIRRSIVLDDADLVDYYRTHSEDFVEPEEYKIRGIYISAETRSADEVEAKKAEIDQKLAAGEEFSTLAGQYSEGPEKDNGGSLGEFKAGQMAKELEEPVKTLNTGEIAPWVEFRGGWFRLMLEEKKESRLKSFEEARSEIEMKMYTDLQQEKLQEYIKRLKARSYIKILIPNPEDRY